MPRVLLLDVDGVIFRNRYASKMVKERIIDYVHRKTHTTLPEAAAINQKAYQTYGHTLIGLNNILPSPIKDTITLTEFNQHVYNPELIEQVKSICTYDITTYEEARDLRHLSIACAHTNIPIYLFSNAPRSWVRTVCDIQGIQLPFENLFCSGDKWLYKGDPVLKPELRTYAYVQNYLVSKYGKQIEILFVDDQASNTEVPERRGGRRWKCFHYQEHDTLALSVVPWMTGSTHNTAPIKMKEVTKRSSQADTLYVFQ